jgi:outer membrane receptor for ferrienterochelin and colicin
MKRTYLQKNAYTNEQNKNEFHLEEISSKNQYFNTKDFQSVRSFGQINKRMLITFLSIWVSLSSFAVSPLVKGKIVDKENQNEVLVGANVYWAGSTTGTTTDAEGNFAIKTGPEYHNLIVSFVGYLSDTVHVHNTSTPITIYLEKNLSIDEVVVKERPKGQYLSTLNPVQSTKVTVTELQKAACCNLSESFVTNASVDVAYTDAVTGAQQIKMLGLSGIYVQTLSENIPSLRGMAAPYGLGYIPGSWMESIQISKGTSSVVNGYEAVTGQINVEYKKSNSNERLHFNLYGNSELRAEANLNASFKLTDSLSTMILLHGENQSSEIDGNHDNFLDMPRMNQINFINRWEKIRKDGGDFQIGVKILNEDRKAGQVGAFENGNNNLYGIGIKTNRYEVYAKNGYMLERTGTSLGLQLSGWYHNQDAIYGQKTYNGTQYNGYFNLIYQGNFGSDLHTFKTGASLLADSFDEKLNNQSFSTTELVPGIYYEYNLNLEHKLNILAGLRADYSTKYGLFFTPRVHAKWEIIEGFTWRASAGKGYRTSIPLAENSYLLASSREVLVDNDLEQEEAVNIGTSLNAQIPIGEQKLSFTVDYYRTNFINQVIKNVDQNPHIVAFTNLDGASFSNAFQAEVTYEPIENLTLNVAYRLNDVKQTIDGQLREMPLNSRYKGLASVSYATLGRKWQFDFTSQFSGGGRLPDPDKVNPLWEKEFKPYTILNGQITKNFKQWSIYAGGENLLNFMMHNPVVAANDPFGNNFDGTMIWGPVHGRKLYAGIRFTINRE